MQKKLIPITTNQQLNLLIQKLSLSEDYASFDCETTGLDTEAIIIGMSLSFEIDIAYYIVLWYWDKDKNQLINTDIELSEVNSFLTTLKTKSLVMHNAIFDCKMVERNFKISLIESVFCDTMVLAHLLDENRPKGLKDLGALLFGEDAKTEQKEMKASVLTNGGSLTKDKYELYKADWQLISKYGAMDTILTLNIFYILIPQLYEQNLDEFFFTESMPLLKGPSYDLNTVGLKVDTERLQKLKGELETDCMDAKAFIYKEIDSHIKERFKGTNKGNTFNIGSREHLSWLLYFKLDNEFNTLSKVGKEICRALDLDIPYSPGAKRVFIDAVIANKGWVYKQEEFNYKTKKMSRPKKIGEPWKYLTCGKVSLAKLEHRYKWVQKLLEYAKNQKLLRTYVVGIQKRMKYGVIYPEFLQCGTSSGRYSSKNPNFQNLPRDDKRIKSCIVARPGNVLVGADYSQLEPRIFASLSKDERLLGAFKDGLDPYSLVGTAVFNRNGCSLNKNDSNSFAKLYPDERNIAKAVMLSATYGTTAYKMASIINKSVEDARQVIEDYFMAFPTVYSFMVGTHEEVKEKGFVLSQFGRPRRIPEALSIKTIYGNSEHSELPYDIRTLLNLGVNYKIQGAAGSIINRSSIRIWNEIKELAKNDSSWNKVKVSLQCHDELWLEGPEHLGDAMKDLLKLGMETTVKIEGVDLVAEPAICRNLSELK